MGLGPARDGEVTFVRLDSVPGWGGMPDVDEAGPRVIEASLWPCGRATLGQIEEWLGPGLGVKRKAIAGWLDRLSDRLTRVAIEGETVLVLPQDLDELEARRGDTTVRL